MENLYNSRKSSNNLLEKKTYLNTKSKLGITLAKRYPSRPSRVERNRNVRLVIEPVPFVKTLKYQFFLQYSQ